MPEAQLQRVESRRIECPRCGYDLCGVATSWTQQCPLEGNCSECGLQLRWCEALNPRMTYPHWSVESRRIDGRYLKAALGTFIRMFRPWRFWRVMSMTLSPRWIRLLLFPVVLAPLLYLVFVIGVGLGMYNEAKRASPSIRRVPFQPAVEALRAAALPFSSTSLVTALYGRGWIEPDWSHLRSPHSISQSYRPQILHEGWTTIRRGSLQRVWHPRTFFPSALLFHACCILLACPLSFAALPQSRRAAKVRWRHIFRIAAYSVVFLSIPLSLDMLHQLSGIWWMRTPSASIAGFVITVLVVMVWWTAATCAYLRMPHAWGVGLAAVGLAFVLELSALALVDLWLDLV